MRLISVISNHHKTDISEKKPTNTRLRFTSLFLQISEPKKIQKLNIGKL